MGRSRTGFGSPTAASSISTADGSQRWVIERGWESQALPTVVGDTLYVAWGRHLVAYR